MNAPADPRRQPEIVVFDWGGVILRICRSWEEGCASAGLPVREGSTTEAMKHARRELAQRYQAGELACEAFFDAVSAATNRIYTAAEIARIHDAWLIAEYPGVDRVVADLLAARQAETGVLSNTNARHWQRHEVPSGAAAPSDDRPTFTTIAGLRHRHASHLLRCAKPDESIYRAFEDATGYRGDSILFFDDLTENINTADRLGWQTHQIDHTGDTAKQIRRTLAAHGLLA